MRASFAGIYKLHETNRNSQDYVFGMKDYSGTQKN